MTATQKARKSASPAPLRGAIYTRISNDPDLTELGVDRQDAACRKLADALDVNVVAHFEDNDITAAKPDKIMRPQFEALLDAIKRGEYDVIIYAHYDRLLRTRKDFDRLVEVALAGGLKRAIGVRSGEIDLSTAAGQMMGAILATLGHYEVQHMVERMQDAARQRAESGRAWTPVRWFGYTMPAKDGTGIEKVKDEAALLEKAYADVLSGSSLMGICAAWNTKGIKTTRDNRWKSTVLRGILLNARNAGIRAYKGDPVAPGCWPAIVDEETYYAVKKKLTDPTRVRRPKNGYGRRWLLTGLIHCKCGELMGSTTNHGAPVYICRKSFCTSRRMADVNPWVIGHVSERLARDDAADLLISRERSDASDLRDRQEELYERQRELQPMLRNPKVPMAMVIESIEDIDRELAEIRDKLGDPHTARVLQGLVPADGSERAEFLALSVEERRKQVDKRFKALALDRQRAVVDLLLSVKVLPGQYSRGPFNRDLVPVTPKL